MILMFEILTERVKKIFIHVHYIYYIQWECKYDLCTCALTNYRSIGARAILNTPGLKII
jgi:hypothetical protein